jgi:hypothetical protein
MEHWGENPLSRVQKLHHVLLLCGSMFMICFVCCVGVCKEVRNVYCSRVGGVKSLEPHFCENTRLKKQRGIIGIVPSFIHHTYCTTL